MDRVIEDQIPEFVLTYWLGTDFDKSVQIFTDEDCLVPKDFTYFGGNVKFKLENDYLRSVLSFSVSNGSLYLGSTGIIRMFRRLENMPVLEEREYRGDCRVRNLSNSKKDLVCRIVLNVKNNANAKG